MVVDTSAIIALLANEPEAGRVVRALLRDEPKTIASPALFETAMAITFRLNRNGWAEANEVLREFSITVVPFTEAHTRQAHLAYVQWGKGRHPAALNFGDCFSYALAKATGQSLLYVGNDFSRTDIEPA